MLVTVKSEIYYFQEFCIKNLKVNKSINLTLYSLIYVQVRHVNFNQMSSIFCCSSYGIET
jgi:hypothetical protein